MNAAWLKERRWFRSKTRDIRDVVAEETFPLDLGPLTVLRVSFADGGSERYVVVGEGESDALSDPKRLSMLLDLLKKGARVKGDEGTLVFRPLEGIDDVKATSTTPKPSAKEQTNTSVPFGDAYILKIVRKLDEGRSAELEMGEFLTRNGYASAPRVLGAIEIERPGSDPATVGILHQFLANRGDAWGFTLERLEKKEPYTKHAELLGRRVAEMHAVLARGKEPTFAPETLDRGKRGALAAAVKKAAREIERHLPAGTIAKIDARVAAFVDRAGDPTATRVHGDLHLGQILVTPDGQDFVIIDFEGEPARPLEERKGKRSPMADVAGMLRSFDYAAATAKTGRDWYASVAKTFLASYGEVPRDVLDFYLIEKCIYEIGYEANNRPDWIGIPLGGLTELLA